MFGREEKPNENRHVYIQTSFNNELEYTLFCVFKGYTQGGVVLILKISSTKVLVTRRTTVNTTSDHECSTPHDESLKVLFFTAITNKRYEI